MEYIIKGRKPECFFRFFEEISAIPRGSGNEKGIADYLEKFAKGRGIEYKRDKVNNIYMSIPATKGRENDPAILLQAHTDMVCEKNAGTEHDFLKDPLDLYLDGNLLRARGTTLGADDGAGVCLILTVLDGAFASHPAIEGLFTVSEEVGMDGVNNFDFSLIKARRLINLDSSGVGTAIVGCAGGVRSCLLFTGKRKKTAGEALKITVSGLAGGHSGENIGEGRSNANKIMARLLLAAKEYGFVISSINGGGKTNAIPRECSCTVITGKPDEVKAVILKEAACIADELLALDKAFSVTVDAAADTEAFDEDVTARVLGLMVTVKNGVIEMSKKIPGFVEYSSNMGVIKTDENGIRINFLARSAIDAQLDMNMREMRELARIFGCGIRFDECYRGWNYAEISPIRDKYEAAYREVTGEKLVIDSIHAGLECGTIKTNIPDMDIIAVGPDEYDIHSPAEALDLDSVELIAKVIEKVLA